MNMGLLGVPANIMARAIMWTISNAFAQTTVVTKYGESADWWMVALTLGAVVTSVVALIIAISQMRSAVLAYRVSLLSCYLAHLASVKGTISEKDFDRWMRVFVELMGKWAPKEAKDLHHAIEESR